MRIHITHFRLQSADDGKTYLAFAHPSLDLRFKCKCAFGTKERENDDHSEAKLSPGGGGREGGRGGKCIGLWGLRHSHFTLSPSLPTPSCSSRREEGRGGIRRPIGKLAGRPVRPRPRPRARDGRAHVRREAPKCEKFALAAVKGSSHRRSSLFAFYRGFHTSLRRSLPRPRENGP